MASDYKHILGLTEGLGQSYSIRMVSFQFALLSESAFTISITKKFKIYSVVHSGMTDSMSHSFKYHIPVPYRHSVKVTGRDTFPYFCM